MADQPGSAGDHQDSEGFERAPEAARGNQGLVFGLLGFAAVVCVCVVAVVMAFLFGKLLQPPNISQNVTIPQPVAAVPPTPAPVNLASRDYYGDSGRSALPGAISNKSAFNPKLRQVAVQRGATYPLPQGGGSMTSSAETILRGNFGTHKFKFLIRADAPGKSGSGKPLAYRFRPYQGGATPQGGEGAPVYGAVPRGSTAGPAVEVSTLPDMEFQPVSTEAGGLKVEVSRLLKTSKTEKFEAVKGLQFLVADLQVTNTSSRDWVLNAEHMEVQEAGGISYGADPDLVEGGVGSKTVEGGSTASFTVAFQVPDSVELKFIAMEAPGSAPLLIPLNKK